MKLDRNLSIILLAGVILFGLFFPPFLFLLPIGFLLQSGLLSQTLVSRVCPESTTIYGLCRPRSPPV
jgi:hypothetical protein